MHIRILAPNVPERTSKRFQIRPNQGVSVIPKKVFTTYEMNVIKNYNRCPVVKCVYNELYMVNKTVCFSWKMLMNLRVYFYLHVVHPNATFLVCDLFASQARSIGYYGYL